MSAINLLSEQLQAKWKFPSTTPIQEQMIPALLEGNDVVAESPTGTGKTLAYVLPMLDKVDGSKKATQALIVAPSQELCMQITDVIRDLIAGTNVTVVPLIGGANPARQIEKLKKKPTIAVGTPGRLNELIKAKKLKPHELTFIVLDEGDQLLGRESRVTVKSFIEAANHSRQVSIVSATITEEIELVAARLLKQPKRLRVLPEDLPSPGTVVHSFMKLGERDKTEMLRRISNFEGVRALAFVNNLDQLLMKETKLNYRNAPIVTLHAEMKKEDRKHAIEKFRKGDARVMIATDVAARGLDIDGLTHVIHVDVPYSAEQYTHRSGRTGRAGKDGEVLTLLTSYEEKDYRAYTRQLDEKPVEKIWGRASIVEGKGEYPPASSQKKVHEPKKPYRSDRNDERKPYNKEYRGSSNRNERNDERKPYSKEYRGSSNRNERNDERKPYNKEYRSNRERQSTNRGEGFKKSYNKDSRSQGDYTTKKKY